MSSIPLSSLSFLFFVVALIQGLPAARTVGINYGRSGTDLPPPERVAGFLARRTRVDGVRIYDADPAVVRAFSSLPVPLTLTVPNSLVPSLASLAAARQWLRTHLPPSAPVRRLLVGNELLSSSNRTLISSLLPALQSLHTALVSLSLHTRVQLSTPLSLSVLARSFPPSDARFDPTLDQAVVRPLLAFLRATGSPFMVNAYPYFGSTPDTLDFALFRAGSGVVDRNTGLLYTNMFDAQLDAVLHAMRRVGFGDVDVAVSETGWPSRGDAWQRDAGEGLAGEYVRRLVEHVGSGSGTPLAPNRTFEVYLFSMFDEDLKAGPESERSFGLFRPDFGEKYQVGLVVEPEGVREAVVAGSWCVPKAEADVGALQANVDYACAQAAVDCSAIRDGGACFFPATVRSHAMFAMNEFYQIAGRTPFACDFAGTGVVISTDPSYGDCKYRS